MGSLSDVSKISVSTHAKCNEFGSIMNNSYWNDDSSSTKQPRMIHGLNDIVYLVSAVYTCDKKHKILAHDKNILNLLSKT